VEKLHNEETNDMFYSTVTFAVIKSRRMSWVVHIVHKGRGGAYTRFWWGNLRETRQLGGPRCRWEDNIKMEIQEVGCGGMDWVELTQDRDRWRALVNAVMKLRVP